MTKSRFLGAAAILAATIAAPAMAQQAMQEPGAYAHIYNYRHGPPAIGQGILWLHRPRSRTATPTPIFFAIQRMTTITPPITETDL